MQRLEFKNMEEALGSIIYRNIEQNGPDTASHKKFQVIGIFDDYYISPLHQIQENRGLVLFLNSRSTQLLNRKYGYFQVKGNPGNSKLLAALKKTYEEYFVQTPFDYFVFNEFIRDNYAQDQLLRHILVIFTTIAIFISALGLFALTGIILTRKTKEIGIRKVLGATFGSIFQQFAKGYLMLMLVTTLFTIPLTWYIANDWLQNYAVRIELSWDLFLIPVLLLALIILVIIFAQIHSVSRTKPLESLRYE